MTKKVAYFDSQASAAAALKIDISELRKAKQEGCPAFRSGRVYSKLAQTQFLTGGNTRSAESASQDFEVVGCRTR
jgi:hypothetical protein